METEINKKGGDERQLVVFNLGTEEFGVNINEVREIIRMEQITHIPNTQEYIKGVINLRGGIIVVINLAIKLGLPTKQADSNTRIIVIEVDGNTVGMIVDSATEVLRLEEEEIKEAPAIIKQKINSDFIDGVGILNERLLILLDLAKVMHAQDMEIIKKMQQSAPKIQQLEPEQEKEEQKIKEEHKSEEHNELEQKAEQRQPELKPEQPQSEQPQPEPKPEQLKPEQPQPEPKPEEPKPEQPQPTTQPPAPQNQAQ
ncbi:purine-binding chemotaxis protein CheW [Candidatus Woesearchaeota archaeon]|nr:purine-binding chemotaxis protein CheW [Candidatus Woesearchaeota archaeon]